MSNTMATGSIVDLSQLNTEKMIREMGEEVVRMLKIIKNILELQVVMLMKKKEVEEQGKREQREMRRREYNKR